jgi:hypothetical protein
MALHGKQMTPEEKQIIVALSQQGYCLPELPFFYPFHFAVSFLPILAPVAS